MSIFRPLNLCLSFALPLMTLQAAAPSLDPAMVLRLRELGLGQADDFRILDVVSDPDGARHVRVEQRYRELPVWGGQAILHLDASGAELSLTDALVRGIQLDPHPNLDPAEALAVTHTSEAPQGAYTRAPTVELVVYPAAELQRSAESQGGRNAMDFAPRITRHHLAYHIHLELQNGSPETRHDDFLVDAHTGAILRKWSTLFTLKTQGVPSTTTGQSQYSGEVKLGSLSASCGYVMADPTRSNISTRDLAGKTSGHGTLYVSQDGRWGDGENYDPGRGTRSQNGQTAAVDAHYGLQTTWDFFKNVIKRKGVDGTGKAIYNRVHYASSFDNAFWDDDCFCMTYGDGDTFKTVTALDVVAHEVAHGLCHSTANLEYEGESGGLNEASSDIFGAMVQLYGHVAHGEGSQLPAKGARWTIGEDLKTPAFPTPLRYMYKPSLDGFSPDAWSPDLDYMDVHFSSGPMNRAFYFLSQGASPKKKSDYHSDRLPKGMQGIGNDKALRIWWRTLSTYLTPRSRYLDARKGAIHAAEDLFGKCSPESIAVRLAFHGINVDERNTKTVPD
jgi:Zn-dependent metalloprotease